MAKIWQRTKVPRITHVCCGYTYDTCNPLTVNFFRCFAHKSQKEFVEDTIGVNRKVNYCITVWLVCKNNECITNFTFYYDFANNLINKIQTKGLNYILNLKDKFLGNIPLKVKSVKIEAKSKKYLWRYTDRHPSKKFVSNIYNLDDKKVGETPRQPVKSFNIID